MAQTKESLERWRIYLATFLVEADVNGLNEIIDLAQKQLKVQERNGSAAKQLAINYLRDLINELECEPSKTKEQKRS